MGCEPHDARPATIATVLQGTWLPPDRSVLAANRRAHVTPTPGSGACATDSSQIRPTQQTHLAQQTRGRHGHELCPRIQASRRRKRGSQLTTYRTPRTSEPDLTACRAPKPGGETEKKRHDPEGGVDRPQGDGLSAGRCLLVVSLSTPVSCSPFGEVGVGSATTPDPGG
jgi:hypothetical protein